MLFRRILNIENLKKGVYMLEILFWVVIVIVACCAVCWMVGFTVFFFRIVHHGGSIIVKTIYAALMPIVLLRAFVRDDIIFPCKNWWYRRRAKWIADELRKEGIALRQIKDDPPYYADYNWLHGACEVVAEVAPEKAEAYRETYARAVRKFRWRWTPRSLCGSAFPQWPLDREWAICAGIDEYFSEHFIFCINCGNKRSMGWYWGNDSLHLRPHNEAFNYSLRRTYRYADGTQKTFPGWLCEDCEKALVGQWESMRC